eukprot:gene17744-biopygen11410
MTPTAVRHVNDNGKMQRHNGNVDQQSVASTTTVKQFNGNSKMIDRHRRHYFKCTSLCGPWGVTEKWRGRGAGMARANSPFVGLGGAGVARAWRGRGADISCNAG